MQPSEETPLSEADARTLRFLRGLVIVLTGTMIAGMALLIFLFATRMSGREAVPAFTVPENLELPAGAAVTAVTRSEDLWIVVTRQGEVLFYEAAGGAPIGQVSMPE